MGIPSSGNISIKSAAGSGRSIDTEVTSVSSGSLVALSAGSIEHTGGTAPPGGTADTNTAPYGMREFYNYNHDNSIWTLGSGATENNYAWLSNNGYCARGFGYDYTTNTLASASAGMTMKVSITNSNSNQSVFQVWLHQDRNVYTQKKWNQSGTESNFFYNAGWWEMYRATFNGSGLYSSFTPDTFQIDYSMTGGEISALAGDTGWTTSTSGGNTNGTYFIDGTDHTYYTSTGTSTPATRMWLGVAYTEPPAQYSSGLARMYGYVHFNVTFKKSGKDDTNAMAGPPSGQSGTWKFAIGATATTAGW
jgi:hypothetical protein